MSNPELIDISLRSGAISLLGVLILLLLRDARSGMAARLGMLVAISLMAMLASVTWSPSEPVPAIYILLRILAAGNTLFVWWFGLALFDDDFKFDTRAVGTGLVWLVVMLPQCLAISGLPVPLPAYWSMLTLVFALVLLGHVIWAALAGRTADLVEPRRRLRLPFMLIMVSIIIIIILAERFETVSGVATTVSIFRNAATLVLTGWVLIWLTRLDAEPLFSNPRHHTTSSDALSARDRLAQARLLSAMDEQQAWSEAGLTIRTLADRVQLPEHRLRRIINQVLGHRNFSSFLCDYRLAEVKRLMSDPAKVDLPILTLAMDAGFASLAPFNRAFRARENMTPSQWRAQALLTGTDGPSPP
jgi:AraC-like DNA-binding protein